MTRKLATISSVLVVIAWPLVAQHPPGQQGSSNVHIVSHLPLGGELTVGDVEIEQELSRPYAYLSKALLAAGGFDVISLKDAARARVIYSWRVDHPELHTGLGALRGRYWKSHDRYFYA